MFPRMSEGRGAETQLSIREDRALPDSPSLLPMPLPPPSGSFHHTVALLFPLVVYGAGAGINEAGPFFRCSGQMPWEGVQVRCRHWVLLPWKVRTSRECTAL